MMMLQIFLSSSLILNSFLLIYLFGLIPFLLFLTILFNIAGVVYIYFLLDERGDVQGDFSSLMLRNENFLNHLQSIYELEMFYGDDTLESLIRHSKEMVQDFYEYGDKYFTAETSPKEEQEENANDTTGNEAENKESPEEESIFYQGS